MLTHAPIKSVSLRQARQAQIGVQKREGITSEVVCIMV